MRVLDNIYIFIIFQVVISNCRSRNGDDIGCGYRLYDSAQGFSRFFVIFPARIISRDLMQKVIVIDPYRDIEIFSHLQRRDIAGALWSLHVKYIRTRQLRPGYVFWYGYCNFWIQFRQIGKSTDTAVKRDA